MTDISRREMLGITAAAFVVPLLSPFTLAARYFTPAEFAMVDELSEMIIPADAHSPGARVARVAGEIDRRLSESTSPEWKATWRDGLRLVDDLSRELHGARLMQASPGQRLAVLTRMAAAERSPQAAIDKFFVTLKAATAQAYYTSKVGIHLDQQYKGNVFQAGDYAGFDAT